MNIAGVRSIRCACLILLLISCGDSVTPPESRPDPSPMIRPSAISVSPTELTFAALADTVRLEAEVLDQDGQVTTRLRVIWSSTDRSVASVSTKGQVISEGNGTATIRATVGSVSTDVRVTVTQVPVGMGVTPSKLEFDMIGDTASLTAALTDANGYAVANSPSMIWSSSVTSVATVDLSGLVTAAGNGSTEVMVVSDSFAVSAPVTVSDNSHDRAALERLYHATGGGSWKNNSSWLTPAPLSQWHGVRVAPNGLVDHLSLGDNGLTGSIPPEIGNMKNLTALQLGDNQLTGTIPPELGQLPLLQHLDITGNQLSGPIPPEFGGLASLRELHASDNNLSGPVPFEIGNLYNLERLVLAFNSLHGLLPVVLRT